MSKFKPIPGYEKLYEIDKAGQVRQLARTSDHSFPGVQFREMVITGKTVLLYKDGKSKMIDTAETAQKVFAVKEKK